MIIGYLKWWWADRRARLAKWIAPANSKPKDREPFDIHVPKELRAAARADIGDRLFGGMKDVRR